MAFWPGISQTDPYKRNELYIYKCWLIFLQISDLVKKIIDGDFDNLFSLKV